jgi:hypothetical protein
VPGTQSPRRPVVRRAKLGTALRFSCTPRAWPGRTSSSAATSLLLVVSCNRVSVAPDCHDHGAFGAVCDGANVSKIVRDFGVHLVTKESAAVISHPGSRYRCSCQGEETESSLAPWPRNGDVAGGTDIPASAEHQAGEFSVEPGLDRPAPAAE